MPTPGVYVYLCNTAPLSRVCQAELLLPGHASPPLMRETVLPNSSAARTSERTAHRKDGVARQLCCGSLLYVHIHISVIISYNIYAHPMCTICIFVQHHSAEPGVPGRAAAAWSFFNTAHARDGIGYAAGLYSYMHIHICIII
jgi:hypothetical protein